MPKEVIEVHTDRTTKAVVVGWTRGMGVQLATLRPDGEEETGASGQYVDLDRHHINRLIRNLRQARDAAFGRDE